MAEVPRCSVGVRTGVRWLAIGVLALVAVGCGGSEGSIEELKDAQDRTQEADSASSSSTTATAPSSTTEATTTAPPATAAPTTTAGPTTTVPPTTSAPPPSLMPDVVCMNLQAAQDFIQSQTGVFLSLSEDASGAGRSQIIDSNWIVVAQRPSPGTPIGEGDAVLSAVKIDEPNPC